MNTPDVEGEPSASEPAAPVGESRRAVATLGWCTVLTLGLVLAALWAVRARHGTEGLDALPPLIGASLFAFGRFVIFGGLAMDTALGPWELAAMVLLIDLLIALVLSWGAPWLERLPGLGPWIARARSRAAEVLGQYPRLESLAFSGVVLFVFLPIAATGAVTGFFAGRLLGLTRAAGFAAIGIGSALSVSLFAALATLLGERGEEVLRSPVLAGFLFLSLALFLRLAYLRITRILRSPPRR